MNTTTLRARPWERDAIALAVAVAVNAGVFLALAWLNGPHEPPETEPASSVLFAELPPPQPEQKEPPDQRPDPADPAEPEPMRVDLDTPTPEAPTPEPVELDLSIHTPTPTPVRVAVRSASDNTSRSASDESAGPRGEPDDRGPVATGLSERPGNPQPPYPRQARRRGIEGTVTVRLTISPDGRVERVEFLDGDPLLRRAVDQVIGEYRFDRPRRNGRPVRAVGTKTFRFELQD